MKWNILFNTTISKNSVSRGKGIYNKKNGVCIPGSFKK